MRRLYSALYGYIVARGETCRDIARDVGLTPQTMSLRMKGKVAFSAKEIARIGEILEIPHERYYDLFIRPVEQQPKKTKKAG